MTLPEAVRRLERALAQGTLAAHLARLDPALLGPEIDGVYHGLLGIEAGRPSARRPWVELALGRFEAALAPPRRHFTVEPVGDALQVIDGPRLTYAEAGRARAWGVGLHGPSDVRDQLLVQAAQAARARLYADLRGIPLIAAAMAEPPTLSDDPVGPAVERLVHDALAIQWAVRWAPLHEDVLAATDLRALVPGGPKRGVRVQVAAALPGARTAQKARQVERAGAVLVSPATLAEASVDDPAASRLFGGPLAVRARLIRDALTTAIKRATADPRGPVAALPPELVALMGAVVYAGRAARSTRRQRLPPLGARPVDGGP